MGVPTAIAAKSGDVREVDNFALIAVIPILWILRSFVVFMRVSWKLNFIPQTNLRNFRFGKCSLLIFAS